MGIVRVLLRHTAGDSPVTFGVVVNGKRRLRFLSIVSEPTDTRRPARDGGSRGCHSCGWRYVEGELNGFRRDIGRLRYDLNRRSKQDPGFPASEVLDRCWAGWACGRKGGRGRWSEMEWAGKRNPREGFPAQAENAPPPLESSPVDLGHYFDETKLSTSRRPLIQEILYKYVWICPLFSVFLSPSSSSDDQ